MVIPLLSLVSYSLISNCQKHKAEAHTVQYPQITMSKQESDTSIVLMKFSVYLSMFGVHKSTMVLQEFHFLISPVLSCTHQQAISSL